LSLYPSSQSGAFLITPTTLSAGAPPPRLAFIASDAATPVSAGGAAIGGFNAPMLITTPVAIGQAIADAQLDPAREFAAGAGGTPMQAPVGGLYTDRPEPPPAGAPVPTARSSDGIEGVLRPHA
jgi:hypothetical protein